MKGLKGGLYMKNKIMILITTLSLGLIVSCALNDNNKPLSQEDLTMAQTVLSINMLDGENVNNLKNLRKSQENSSLNQEVADKVLSQIEVIEDALSYNPLDVNVMDSDREEYDKKLEATLTDINGKNEKYILYYNYSLSHEEKDEEEVEKTYSLKGLAYVSNVEYQINGVFEEEIEGLKKEQETEIKVSLDDKNYVLISQEIEDSETEYSFSLFKNGVMEEEYEIEIEDRRNHIAISIQEERNNEEFEIEFYKSKTTSNNVIGVKVEINNKVIKGEIVFVEDLINGSYYELKFDGDSNTYKKMI